MDDTEYLKNYDSSIFVKPSFTVDLVIFTVVDDQLRVLLVKRSEPPFQGWWALPGGYVDVARDTTVEDCARRKLREKTGVEAPYLEQLRTYGSKDRDPRDWTATTVYFALMVSEAVEPVGKEESRWMPIEGNGVGVKLAFDHACLLADAIERLRSKLEYTHIAVHLLPESFTLPELQKTYEIILQEPLDKSSFRRRVTQADMLEEVPGKQRDGSGRPAQLYRFKRYERQTFFPRSMARYAR